MNLHQCLICKSQGKKNTETVCNEIYNSKGRELMIFLCYVHTIELFKMGQVNFIQRYHMDFSDYLGFEDQQVTFRYFSIK